MSSSPRWALQPLSRPSPSRLVTANLNKHWPYLPTRGPPKSTIFSSGLIFSSHLLQYSLSVTPIRPQHCSSTVMSFAACPAGAPLQWWLFYDSQFRRLKARDPSMSWGAIHQELYLHLQPGSNANKANKANLRSETMRRGPEGVCWQQWNDGNCDKENCNSATLPQRPPPVPLEKLALGRHHAPHRSNHPGGQNTQ